MLRVAAVVLVFLLLSRVQPDPASLAGALPAYTTLVRVALVLGILLLVGAGLLLLVDRGMIAAPAWVRRRLIEAPRRLAGTRPAREDGADE